MLGAVIRSATGFVFGGLLGAVVGRVASFARPLIVEGLGEAHEITRYVDAFAEYWILVALFGALLGILASAVAERGAL